MNAGGKGKLMLKFVVSVIAFVYACALCVYAGDETREIRSKALAHFIMAEIHDFNGNAEDAITEYERAASLDRGQPLPRLRLASYYARAGLLDQAQAQIKSALAIEPSMPQAHYLMALIYSSKKQYDLAAKEFEKIISSDLEAAPRNLEIHTNLAQLYFSQHKYYKAIEEFHKILTIIPEHASTHYFLGSSYLEVSDFNNAKEQFKQVVRLEPTNDQGLNSLAYVNALLGENLDESLIMAKLAIDIDPNNGAYYDTLGWVLFKKGLPTDSILMLQKAEVYIKDPVLFDHMGDVYLSMKEYPLARKYWRKSLELDALQNGVQEKINSLEKIQALKEP